MHTDTVSIAQFVKDNGITMTAARTDRNPNMQGSRDMDHWQITLRRQGKVMTTYFSMGFGHNGKAPTVADVLDCLASDSASVENARGFEDWCNDFGYDTDSRSAEKTFKTCEHAAKRLRNFVGDGYETLVYGTERL